jgi:Tol biopolymer transport system component
MKRVILFSLITAALATAQTSKELFQQGLVKERSEGKLEEAMQLYRRAAGTAGKDRALAAKVLMQLAACYEKLGNTESRKIYERVVREYADQTESVAIARARMGSNETAARPKGDRPVWTGPEVDMFGRISPDGRYLPYVDWFQTGNLMVHDMVTGADHPLTKNRSWKESTGGANFSSISRDGKQIVYEWWERDGADNHLVLAQFHGASISEPRRLLISPEIRSIRPFDWSPDDQWIAVHLSRVDHTSQIGLVAVKDGKLRVLRSVDWRGPSNMCFSQDGRFVFYDLPESNTTSKRDIYVLAVDGSRGHSLVMNAADDTLVGLSRDGQLLFASDRTGSKALWSQSIGDGTVKGSPQMIKSDFGSPWIQGMTASGALYVTKVVSDEDVHFAPVDLAAGKLLATPTGVQRFPSRGRPAWSEDGKFLSYIDCGIFGGGPCTISVRDMETSQVREIRPALHYFAFPRWSPDGGSFVTSGTDLKGRRGVYFIDAATGETRLITEQRATVAGWAPDGRSIFLLAGRKLVERELVSEKEREVFSMVNLPPRDQARMKECGPLTLSPDAKLLACVTEQAVVVIPTNGGEARELLRVDSPESLVQNSVVSWTLAGSAVVVAKRLADGPRHLGGPRELWLVPVSSGAPRRLDIDTSGWNILNPIGARFSTDGRYVAFMAGKGAMEVWALEAFLPSKGGRY